jgi:hypothetical protein
MRRWVTAVACAAWLVTACGGDGTEADLSEDDAVRVAGSSIGLALEDHADPEVRIDGLCAEVTFPGGAPVVLHASDGAWAVMAQGEALGSGYEPGAINCLHEP